MSRNPRRSHPLLVPVALTVTAIAATASLWYFSESSTSPDRQRRNHDGYASSNPGSDSEHEPLRSSSRHLQSHRKTRLGLRERQREHDRITEEDTEDLEDERRREESRRRGLVIGGERKDGSREGSRRGERGDRGERERVRGELTMRETVGEELPPLPVGALELRGGEAEGERFGEVPVAAMGMGLGAAAVGGDAVGAARDIHLQTHQNTYIPPPPSNQYVPPPPPKRKVAIVISERAALTGHESDEDFEEAGLPSSLLQHLPTPLDLTHTDLFILIHSPHLPAHPLSTPHPTSAHPHSHPPPPPADSTLALASTLPVPREHIMPFTAAASMVPMLRQLAPETVYIEEALVADGDGAAVGELLSGGWVRDVVVVVKLGGGIEALMSDDGRTDVDDGREDQRWWGRKDGVRGAFGKRCGVVEAIVLAEDWHRRVEER